MAMTDGITFFIPAKGASQRIPHKNRQRLTEEHTLLSWTLAKLRRWYPQCRLVVATDCDLIRRAAQPYACEDFPLLEEELTGLALPCFERFLAGNRDDPALLIHATSPFTFRSEIDAALKHHTPVVVSGLYILPSPPDDFRQSQTKERWCQLTGNFILVKGADHPPSSTWLSYDNMSEVSHLASFDIDFPHELEQARLLASALPLPFFDN